MHEQITDALRRGANGEALAAAQAAVDANANDTRALHLLALAQRANGDGQAAMATIDRAIAVAPDDATLHFQRAGFQIGVQAIDKAQEDLTRTIELDPNRFNAYILQAELAIGRGDLDEAERLARVAGRIEPDHPVLASVVGMVALRRGDRERALAVLDNAHARAPDNLQILNALGFAYLANGHLAFAEQAFRRLRDSNAGGPAQQRLLADIMHRQGRHEEALEELAPLLEASEGPSLPVLRAAGEVALAAGQPQRAQAWLRAVLAEAPDNRAALDLIMEAWRQLGDVGAARNALDAALATSPQVDQLWLARFSVTDPGEREALVGRWLGISPDSVAAHEAKLALHAAQGDADAVEETVRRIIELEPGNIAAEGRLLDILMRRDPQAALQRAQELQKLPQDEQMKRMVRGWLALANDGAGKYAEAARIWSELHSEVAERLIPLQPMSKPEAEREPAAAITEAAPTVVFLAGLPGTGIEYVARLLEGVVPAFRSDRVRGGRPGDPLQNVNTIPGLAEGRIKPAEVAVQWRAALPARGIGADSAVIDWLLWWDNVLLDVIRPHVPQARIVLALRDPRDMLINWLAFGAPVPLKLGTPKAAAQWLADSLEHVAVLQEQDLQPHTVLRVDDVVNDPEALALQVGDAIELQLPVPPADLFQSRRFPAGHWRGYADALREPFAILAPVAVRLGYPET